MVKENRTWFLRHHPARPGDPGFYYIDILTSRWSELFCTKVSLF